MTKNYLEELKAPFEDCELEWRVSHAMKTQNGLRASVVPYVASRAVMNRLDSVFGIEGWKVEYSAWKEKATKCRISVRIDGEWISKEDGAEDTEYESIKGGFSAALKRAAVLFGIGRYLYYIGTQWVELHESKRNPNDIYTKHQKKGYYFTPPKLDAPKNTSGSNNNGTVSPSSGNKIIEEITKLIRPLNLNGDDMLFVYNKINKTNLKNWQDVKLEKLNVIKSRLELVHQAKHVQGNVPDKQFHNWMSIHLNSVPINSYKDWLLYDIRNLVKELVDLRTSKQQSA